MRKAPYPSGQARGYGANNHHREADTPIVPASRSKIKEEHMETYEIAGKVYPVLEIINGIPLLNIRMMSDERERELASRKAVET